MMLYKKISFVLALTVLLVVQGSPRSTSPPRCSDSQITTSISTATSSVQQAATNASNDVNNALTHIRSVRDGLSNAASVANDFQTIIVPQLNIILNGLYKVADLKLQIKGEKKGFDVSRCLDAQIASIDAIPSQKASDFQSCVSDINNKVNSYYNDVVKQQTAASSLVSSASSSFAACRSTFYSSRSRDNGNNCNLYWESTVTCINNANSMYLNQANNIAQSDRSDSTAVDNLLGSNTLRCGVTTLSNVAVQAGAITTAMGVCFIQAKYDDLLW